MEREERRFKMNLYGDILELVNPAAKKARMAEERRKVDAEKAVAARIGAQSATKVRTFRS